MVWVNSLSCYGNSNLIYPYLILLCEDTISKGGTRKERACWRAGFICDEYPQ